MPKSDLPNICDLDSEQLLSLRNAVDVRLEEIRTTFIEQAQRLGLVVTNGDSKRKRKPRAQREEQQ